MKITFSFSVLLALSFISAFSELSILSPPKLQEWFESNRNEAKTSLAAFGHVPWGRKVIGRLQLAEPIEACDTIRQIDDKASQHSIMIALRGNCPFVVKAHYAQLAGAKMLIVVDTEYQPVESHLMVDFMGQGETVVIPAALIGKKAGDKLVESLKNPDKSISTINGLFDFPLNKANKVEYHIWLSSASKMTYKFVTEWRAFEQKLHSEAKMVPHYAHHKTAGPTDNQENPNCLCGGRYCAPDPDDVRDNTGADVLLENLRQMCIIKEYSMKAWWEYMSKYDDFCVQQGNMNQCGRNSILDLGLDYQHIQRCVNQTFDTSDPTNCKVNKRLDEEETVMLKDGISFYPSVSINGFTYRGNLVPAMGVFEAVCETFSKMPNVCKQYIGVTTTETPNYIPILISAGMFLTMFSVFICCCYRRFLKRDMYKQMVRDVNIALSQYVAMKESEEGENETNRMTEQQA